MYNSSDVMLWSYVCGGVGEFSLPNLYVAWWCEGNAGVMEGTGEWEGQLEAWREILQKGGRAIATRVDSSLDPPLQCQCRVYGRILP